MIARVRKATVISVLLVRVQTRLAVLRVLPPGVPVQRLARPIVRCVAVAKVLIVLHANRVKTATLHVRRAVIQPSVRLVHPVVTRHVRHVQRTVVQTETAALIAVARQWQNVQAT